MAIHAKQDAQRTSIFQETDTENSSESSEYLHHSRAREITNTSKLQCYIENRGYGF